MTNGKYFSYIIVSAKTWAFSIQNKLNSHFYLETNLKNYDWSHHTTQPIYSIIGGNLMSDINHDIHDYMDDRKSYDTTVWFIYFFLLRIGGPKVLLDRDNLSLSWRLAGDSTNLQNTRHICMYIQFSRFNLLNWIGDSIKVVENTR